MKTQRIRNRIGFGLCAALLGTAGVTLVRADTLTISWSINQATQDGTGPAVNNPALNQIVDGSSYIVTLDFTGSVSAPGTYGLTGSSLLFDVASVGAAESDFNFVFLTVTESGGFDSLSLFACLTGGSGCGQGNQLSLSFRIPAANLNSANVEAQAIPGLLPLDLLEDDGVTDIHGGIAAYSYTPPSPTPEPSPLLLMGAGALVIALANIWRRSGK